ncbi:MAG TPA: BlaI/MecI/CopY family transcriptional regulator [Vicinamibacteria bacterium]|nr:BlaI/MecI/CopY family transcriptional regulator [Vicinamibacteria bacterium]
MTLKGPFGREASPADKEVPGLGRLEQRVMAALWRGGERSVRDVQEAFAGELAYTTLMTTMDRLFRKGLLARCKQGRAYVYSARVSHGELRQSAARGLLARLLGADRESARPILSSIVESVSERDRELLDDLEQLVQARRRALEKGEVE